MADLPSGMSYGTVRGTYIQAIADGADANTLPDSAPMVGSITFTPNVSSVLLPFATPPTTMMPKPVTVALDSFGSFEVSLLATDNPNMQPTGWTYNVRFNFVGVTYAAYNIEVPAGQIRDLTLAAPVPARPGNTRWAYAGVIPTTQAEYDALTAVTPGVLYAIVG